MTCNPVSAMLTSLPMDFESAVRRASALGFTHVDIIALADRPASHLEVLAETGVVVSCAAIGRDLPGEQTLEAVDVANRQAAVRAMQLHIADAARLGTTRAYVVPGLDHGPSAMARFTESCSILADYASQRMMRLCVEHIPGRALARAADVLAWLEGSEHQNLSLLVDIGHCLISSEDPAEVIAQAGPRLGYVHFDDNDGVGDLHWPLLTGRLTQDCLDGTCRALAGIGYKEALALELNPANSEPAEALRAGKELLERIWSRSTS
jgi:sugar phosphate isomerase/epimerase